MTRNDIPALKDLILKLRGESYETMGLRVCHSTPSPEDLRYANVLQRCVEIMEDLPTPSAVAPPSD